jgi:hypothetical protein
MISSCLFQGEQLVADFWRNSFMWPKNIHSHDQVLELQNNHGLIMVKKKKKKK